MTLHQNGLSEMFLLLILFSCLLTSKTIKGHGGTCLSGYMTDLQSWVDEFGNLTSYVDRDSKIDLSGIPNPISEINHFLKQFGSTNNNTIRYFSMARCGLRRIPSVFKLQDNDDRYLAETLEYMTFYGNDFSMVDQINMDYDLIINATNIKEEKIDKQKQFKSLSAWGTGFRMINFKNLLELDLRACAIQSLGTYTFYKMPKLLMLYLSENKIYHIEANTFSRLSNLRHLDMSQNYAVDDMNTTVSFNFESVNEFHGSKLESLDFSYSQFGQRNMRLLLDLVNLKSLSLCYSGLSKLKSRSFDGTSLRFLDLSGNNEIFHLPSVLRGVDNTLQVLYAQGVGLKNMDCLLNLTNLEIAQLRKNEIAAVPQNVAQSLKNLQILDLSYNRIISWFTKVFSLFPNLKLLLLNGNHINIVSNEMFDDFLNLTYVGLSDNFLVCSCNTRDMHEISYKNEFLTNPPLMTFLNDNYDDVNISFNKGLRDFNKIIMSRQNTSSLCDKITNRFDPKIVGNYVLLIDEGNTESYRCLLASEGKVTSVDRIANCASLKREYDFNNNVKKEWKLFFLLLIPVILLPVLLFIYIYRKNFKYFCITMRNSTMLSLISKDEVPGETTIFNYDAFISYCNEDRTWVLDNFLPHVEKDCSISVCLHERDFQVGLPILENIVSCMDRSRSIILIISKRFLLSQWCQFEMHLAQHRLLETRREDLILVLLEEIPRRLRPNTLHYLMLTKTYILWPKEEKDQNLFWKRMKKSIVTLKLKHSENVSLA